MRDNSGHERYRTLRQVGLLGTIPMLMAAYPTAGFFLGKFLDGKLGTAPVLSIVLIVGGVVTAIRDIARLIRKANRLVEEDSRPGNERSDRGGDRE